MLCLKIAFCTLKNRNFNNCLNREFKFQGLTFLNCEFEFSAKIKLFVSGAENELLESTLKVKVRIRSAGRCTKDNILQNFTQFKERYISFFFSSSPHLSSPANSVPLQLPCK